MFNFKYKELLFCIYVSVLSYAQQPQAVTEQSLPEKALIMVPEPVTPELAELKQELTQATLNSAGLKQELVQATLKMVNLNQELLLLQEGFQNQVGVVSAPNPNIVPPLLAVSLLTVFQSIKALQSEVLGMESIQSNMQSKQSKIQSLNARIEACYNL